MDAYSETRNPLPSADQIRLAIELYLACAYRAEVPDSSAERVPPKPFDPVEWLMSDVVERDPAEAPLEAVRSFALRLGNSQYPHMKLRISRPPKDEVFLFSVDSHDAFLRVPPDSPDFEPLEALKCHNSRLAVDIYAAWDAAGLPTEKSYLRQKIEQARNRPAPPPEPPAT